MDEQLRKKDNHSFKDVVRYSFLYTPKPSQHIQLTSHLQCSFSRSLTLMYVLNDFNNYF